VSSRLSTLSELWEKMGLDTSAVRVRCETVQTLLDKTLLTMIEEEETTMQNIIRAIETHYKERAKLAKVTLQPRVCVSRSVCKRVQRGTISYI
jgi:6-pyruvoyl-tetrahydropterin synthase